MGKVRPAAELGGALVRAIARGCCGVDVDRVEVKLVWSRPPASVFAFESVFGTCRTSAAFRNQKPAERRAAKQMRAPASPRSPRSPHGRQREKGSFKGARKSCSQGCLCLVRVKSNR